MSAVPDSVESAIAVRDFRYYLGFRFCLTLALQMQGVVVGWQVYEITRSPLSLGLVGLAEAVSYIGTSLFGGHVADIVVRRRILLVCAAMYTACSAAMLGVTMFVPATFAHVAVIFYVIIFLTGVARGFIAPAIYGIFAQVVPRRLYLNAGVWSANFWYAAAVAGPAIGGLSYGYLGVVPAYLTLIGFMLCSIFSMWRIPSYPLEHRVQEENIFQSIAKGVAFVFSSQVILGALSLDLVAVLFGGAVAVLPVFASDVLHTGPEGLGWLRAATFLGSISMGLYMARRAPMRRAGPALLGCVAGFGACMIVFALSRNYALSFVMLFLSGAFDCISVIVRSTTLQLMMPDHMRGRVAAVNNIFIGTSNELGAFESGFAANFLGLVPSVVIGGCISILTVIVAALVAPKLRTLNLQTLLKTEAPAETGA
jgi:MFS family permease